MNWKTCCLYLLLVVCVSAGASAQDAIQSLLIQPDVLMRHREQLKLSDEQVERLRAKVTAAEPASLALKERTEKAIGKLAELLSADHVEEAAALTQLDQVIAAENDQKRLHLRVMIQVRNLLSAEQLLLAKKLHVSPRNPAELEQRLTAKIERIKKAVQERAQAGKPPFEVIGLMQKLPELMNAGRTSQAEALLDRVLVMLGLEKESGRRGGVPAELEQKAKRLQQRVRLMAQDGKDVSRIQQQMQRVGPLLEDGKFDDAVRVIDEALRLTGDEPETPKPPGDKPKRETSSFRERTPGEVRGEIAALTKEDVPWRKIAWKTCLLEGLQASRAQNKPVMLWIFIDRPIDDERC